MRSYPIEKYLNIQQAMKIDTLPAFPQCNCAANVERALEALVANKTPVFDGMPFAQWAHGLHDIIYIKGKRKNGGLRWVAGLGRSNQMTEFGFIRREDFNGFNHLPLVT